MISKSQYVKGCQCPKALWLSLKRKDLTLPVDESRQAIFDAGNEVGIWAKKCFSNGVEVAAPYYNPQQGAQDTLSLIKAGHEVIFEATAIHSQDGSYARIDILRKTPDQDGWDMIEVKGSTSVKDYHHDDMAFQYRVFTGAGYRINRCYMMLIDNSYVRAGEVDPNQLFKLEEITDLVKENQDNVSQAVAELSARVNDNHEPDEKIGSRCFKPYDCDYVEYCWRGKPDYSIYSVLTGNKADEVVESLQSYEVKSLPVSMIPKGNKAKDVQSYLSGEVYVEPENIRQFLGTLQYPLYYLDYETISSAVPLFEGTKPFQNIPFQFSLHVQRELGGALNHYAFLHKEVTDPRSAFVEALVKLCGNAGSVIVYNRPFEAGVNTALAELYPEYAPTILAINARMADLLIPFQKRWLYHPSQKSSASIKYVLPAFTGRSYDDLAIGNGQIASQQYLNFMRGSLSPEATAALWKNLDAYCEQDTIAMKELLDVLRGYV